MAGMGAKSTWRVTGAIAVSLWFVFGGSVGGDDGLEIK